MMNYLFTKTPLVFFIQSFWRDEAFTYVLAKQSLLKIIIFTAKDFNPPLYYFIIHFWMQIFGTSEIALRLFSLVCYWGVVYVGFLFLRNIFKLTRNKSLFYLVFFIINPLLVYYAFEARMYALLALFSAMSFYFFYQRKKLPFIFSTVAGLYTHYFMLFVLLGQLFFIFLVKERTWLKQIKPVIFSAVGFIPWLIFILVSKPIFSQSFWLKKPSILYALHFFGIIYTGHESEITLPIIQGAHGTIFLLNLTLFFLILIGAIKICSSRKKNDRQIFLLLSIWGVLIPLFIGLVSFIKPIYLPRYLIFSTFGFIALLIFILNKLTKKSTLVFITIIIIMTIFYDQYQVRYRKKANLGKAIQEIKAISHKNDLLYVTNELDYFPGLYYFDENRVYLYQKSYSEIPDYVGKVLIPQDRITNKLPVYPQKAFIFNKNGTYDIQAIY